MTATALRFVLLALTCLVVALIALVAYLVGDGRAEQVLPAPAAAAGAPAGLGTITMTGEGEVTAIPDQMTFRVAVTRTAPDVATAMDQASTTMRRVLSALGEQGVERRDTESTGLSVDPQYRYVDNAPPLLTGYRVRQSMSVLVRDLSTGGKAVAGAVRAGGNAVRVDGIGLRVGDQEALLSRARTTAVEDATARAEQYAEATGQPLGRVLTVREGKRPGRAVRSPGRVLSSYGADRVSELKSVPIRAGRTDVGVKVTVVWALEG